MKRIFASCFIILIMTMSFITGYTKSDSLVYADSTTDQWTQVTTNEQLVEAFRYYCKSRDLTIDGSIADGVTQFTTQTFNGICNTLGIDITALQAQIKYQTDENLGLKFLFSANGVNVFNRIFAQFLQDNNLSVGDSVDKTVYDGKMFTDDEGNKCLVYVANTIFNQNDYSAFTSIGTPLKYSQSDLINLGLSNGSAQFQIMGNSYSVPLYHNTDNYVWALSPSVNSTYVNNAIKYELPHGNLERLYANGIIGIGYNSGNGSYVFGVFVDITYKRQSPYHYLNFQPITLNNSVAPNMQNVNIYITTNNNVINNNNYEGDTIINNNGTPSQPSNPDPGGGGGNTTTPPTNTGGGSGEDDGTITFPDFDFHLPEINWSLGDLSEKFPFSIPFDLIAFFTVLNAEPQAPAIDADIPLGSWYTWHFEADFAQFDNYAVIIRNVEFIGFCVGLIYLTIKLVKG